MRTTLLAIAILSLSGAPTLADGVSEKADSISIAIYSSGRVETSYIRDTASDMDRSENGLAFITETRTVDIPAGGSEIKFRGVASTMVAQTANITGLPDGTLERNFDYDLLSPGSLLARSIGETVHLVRTDPQTGKKTQQDAVIRSAPQGVVLDIDGKIEALRCSGLPETLTFDRLPDGLVETPTLSVRLKSPIAGRYTIKLSYIATGLQWAADYVARMNRDKKTFHLTGSVTLANFGTTGFHDVQIQFLAGNLNEVGDDRPIDSSAPVFADHCWPTSVNWVRVPLYSSSPVTAVAQQEVKYEGTGDVETVVVTGSRISDFRALGDYKLYELPEPASIAANEIKQIQFLDLPAVSFDRMYSYIVDDARDKVVNGIPDVLFRLQNRKDLGLGKPLPAGVVSMFDIAADGDSVLLGQGRTNDISVGEQFDVYLGGATNIDVERHLVDSQTVDVGKEKRTQDTYVVDVTNNKPNPVRLELLLGVYTNGAHLVSESMPHQAIPGGVMWPFELQPGAHSSVRISVMQPYLSQTSAEQ